MYKKKGGWCQPYFVACKTVSKCIYCKLKKSDKRFIHKLVSQLKLRASFLMSALNRLFPISKQKLPVSVTECLWPNLLISVFWKIHLKTPQAFWLHREPWQILASLKIPWLFQLIWRNTGYRKGHGSSFQAMSCSPPPNTDVLINF